MPAWIKRALTTFPYVVLLFAILFLWRELRDVDWAPFFAELRRYSAAQLGLASLIVLLHYLLLSLYDLIGLKQLEERLPYPLVLFTSSVACAISNLVGHSVVTGLGARIRNYGRVGLGISKITQLMVMNVESWWAGFAFLFGIVLMFFPLGSLRAYSQLLSVAGGAGLLGVVAIYLLACWRLKGRTVNIGKAQIYLADFRLGVAKVLVGALDTIFLSLTLYVLLPRGLDLSFERFFALHLSAHIIGVVTMVPGGFGVLEGVLLKLLEPYGPPASFLASILLFRLFHYILPAALAVIAEALDVWRRRRSLTSASPDS